VGIIKSPLPERDISADKIQKPADLLMLVLNKLKEIKYNVHEQFLLGIRLVWRLTLYQKREVIALFIYKLPKIKGL